MARLEYDIKALLAQLEPVVRLAFERAIQDITSEAQLSAIAGHLASGNVEAAMVALNLRPEFFAPLDDALIAARIEAGRQATRGLPALTDPFLVRAFRCALTLAIQAQRDGRGNSRRD